MKVLTSFFLREINLCADLFSKLCISCVRVLDIGGL